MAKVRLITEEPREVPWLGRIVEPDEVVEVPDGHYDSYVCQPDTWEPVEEPKTVAPRAKTTTAKRAGKDGE